MKGCIKTTNEVNMAEEIEKASEYYAHNYFDMHETNSYKELKRGFEAGVKWVIENNKQV